MNDPTLWRLFEYSDWANTAVCEAAATLSDEQLDRPLEIGPKPGSLRRILLHILSGESVWLSRWKGNVENAWPNELVKTPVREIAQKLASIVDEQEAFLATLHEGAMECMQTYRDSKGSLFRATLRDMLLQGLIHSAHHRAQAANAIRQVGGEPPELDLMYHFRAE